MPKEHLGSVHTVTVHLVCDPFAHDIVIQMNPVKMNFTGINIIAVLTTVHHGVI